MAPPLKAPRMVFVSALVDADLIEVFRRSAKSWNKSLPQMYGMALENYALDKLNWDPPASTNAYYKWEAEVWMKQRLEAAKKR